MQFVPLMQNTRKKAPFKGRLLKPDDGHKGVFLLVTIHDLPDVCKYKETSSYMFLYHFRLYPTFITLICCTLFHGNYRHPSGNQVDLGHTIVLHVPMGSLPVGVWCQVSLSSLVCFSDCPPCCSYIVVCPM